MARQIERLSAKGVEKLAKLGRHADGGGLYLVVDKRGAKRWVFIYRRKRDGKRSEKGLGGYVSVSLARARELAGEARAQLSDGKDPVAEGAADQAAKRYAHVRRRGRCRGCRAGNRVAE